MCHTSVLQDILRVKSSLESALHVFVVSIRDDINTIEAEVDSVGDLRYASSIFHV